MCEMVPKGALYPAWACIEHVQRERKNIRRILVSARPEPKGVRSMNTRPKLTRLAVAAALAVAVAVVVVAAVGAARSRVVAANDRVNERRETARSVCAARGGEWAQARKHETCVKAEVASKQRSVPWCSTNKKPLTAAFLWWRGWDIPPFDLSP